MLPEFSLSGRVALVTGGGRGIGRAIAIALGRAGADMAVAARTESEVEAAAAEIEGLGRKSLAIAVDVSHRPDVESMVQRVLFRFGHIDILVNSAAIYGNRGPALECPEEDWDQVMDVNVKGVFLCCQAAGRAMASRRTGSIINIASRNSQSALGGSAAYATSKAAVWMLTRALARELAPSGVRVNSIGPGATNTSMIPQDKLKAAVSQIPLGRYAEPEDIAGVALFLASDAARYVTGEIIYVDGGRSA